MVKLIDMPLKYRAFFVSDLHGDYLKLEKLLNKYNYDKQKDYLFILGDMIEKGDHNLATLRYIIKVFKDNSKAFATLGNNDDCLVYIHQTNTQLLFNYLKRNKKSILWEMAKELSLDINQENYQEVFNIIKLVFQEEINFMTSLPLIIDSNDFILAHAGVYPSQNYLESDRSYILSNDSHGFIDYKYPKPLIVGHWGSVFYHQKFILNPKIDLNRNIISIDGCNSIKDYGQQNILILEKDNDNKNFYYDSIDDIQEYQVLSDQIGTTGIKIIWPFNQVEIIKQEDDFSLCRLKKYQNRGVFEIDYNNIEVRIPSNLIYKYPDDKYYTLEFGNYFLDLKKGDLVKLITNDGPYLIAKFKNEIGLIDRRIVGDKYGN